MFGRIHSQDGDVVAAAQRRLAALAEQHERSLRAPGLWPVESSDDAPTERTVASSSPEGSAPPSAEGARAPRHLRTMPQDYGRWAVNAHHLAVAALAVVALVIAVAWWSLRSVPQTESVELSSGRTSPASPAPAPPALTPSLTPPSAAGAAGTSAQPSRLVVDVAGKVRRPGIVELPAGSRVVDALSAAGGANRGVSLTSLNLARLLVDGEQIVVGIDVPFTGAAPAAAPGISPGAVTPSIAPVDLNTATAEQLDTLPGVGPVTAQAILTFRSTNGAFTDVSELLEVSGIGDATLADLRPYVYV